MLAMTRTFRFHRPAYTAKYTQAPMEEVLDYIFMRLESVMLAMTRTFRFHRPAYTAKYTQAPMEEVLDYIFMRFESVVLWA